VRARVLDQRREARRRERPGADLDQRADQPAHHLPEEVRGDDAEEQQVARRRELGALDLDQGRAFGAPVREAREVVTPGECRGGRGHRRDVERPLDPPDEALAEGGAPVGDLVEVGARERIVARVEARVGRRQREQVDVARQAGVDRGAGRLGVERARQAQVRLLRRGVHPRVGAPRAAELDRRARHRLERAPQLAGDRAGVLLLLPPPVARPLVLDGEAIGRHGALVAPPLVRPGRPACYAMPPETPRGLACG